MNRFLCQQLSVLVASNYRLGLVVGEGHSHVDYLGDLLIITIMIVIVPWIYLLLFKIPKLLYIKAMIQPQRFEVKHFFFPEYKD